MKKIILISIFAAMFSLVFNACNSSTTNKDNSTQTTGKIYTCPMHPEVTSDKPGQCPKCGMTLEEKKDTVHAVSKDTMKK